MRALLVLAAAATLAACASAGGEVGADAGGDDLDLAAVFSPIPASHPDADTSQPFGSTGNPVRAAGAVGQRDYLARLRCADGLPPTFDRRGSLGTLGPYGKVLDLYEVTCRDEPPREVVMDLYHCAQDDRVVEGFQLMEALGAPLTQEGCAAQ